ncbi:MAG TPA: SRPBCC family protein [Candidatus Acidoferrum sp.]|nr:SRPBCC family protein [Candidatus Acidoferrum sp.]
MADLEFSADIAAPPNEIFAFFIPQRMPLWYGAEMDSEFEVQGGASEFALGQKIRIAGKLGRRAVSLTVVVTAYEWERLLEWRFHDAYGVRGLQRWDLAPVASGTRLRMRDSYEMPGALGRFVDRIFTRYAVARRDRSCLARLRHLAERQSAP